jgi:ribosomal protein L44E
VIPKTLGQHVTIVKKHTIVILERMGPRPYGDMLKSVRRIQRINKKDKNHSTISYHFKKVIVEERMILKKLKCTYFPLRK